MHNHHFWLGLFTLICLALGTVAPLFAQPPVQLTVAPKSPCPAGTALTLTGTSSLNSLVDFQFTVGVTNNKGKTRWTLLQRYSNQYICVWKPTIPGKYLLRVSIRHQNTTEPLIGLSTLPYIITKRVRQLSSVVLAADKPSPQQVNTTIKLTATPTDGNKVEFKFFAGKVTDAKDRLLVMRNYQTNNRYIWIPRLPGAYVLLVQAREVGNKQAFQVQNAIYFTINKTGSDIIVGKGTITQGGVEGPEYGITSDVGRQYDPLSLPKAFQHYGLPVSFRLKPRPDLASFHQWGIIVDVLEIHLNPNDVAIPVKVSAGSDFTLLIPANHTTGYSWQVISKLPKQLELVKIDYIASDSGLVGAGGFEIWQFHAKASGSITLPFGLFRPWEKDIPPVETRTYVVNICVVP